MPSRFSSSAFDDKKASALAFLGSFTSPLHHILQHEMKHELYFMSQTKHKANDFCYVNSEQI